MEPAWIRLLFRLDSSPHPGLHAQYMHTRQCTHDNAPSDRSGPASVSPWSSYSCTACSSSPHARLHGTWAVHHTLVCTRPGLFTVTHRLCPWSPPPCHAIPAATQPRLLAAQMTDTQRRTSAAPSPKIPPAPPLPLPKQKSRSYFERFVAQPLTAYGSRPSVQVRGLPNPLVPKLPGYVSTSSLYMLHSH
jgi:hypothetical protein